MIFRYVLVSLKNLTSDSILDLWKLLRPASKLLKEIMPDESSYNLILKQPQAKHQIIYPVNSYPLKKVFYINESFFF